MPHDVPLPPLHPRRRLRGVAMAAICLSLASTIMSWASTRLHGALPATPRLDFWDCFAVLSALCLGAVALRSSWRLAEPAE